MIQIFVCDEIDGEKFLRAQMTQTCDPSSARRQSWKIFGVLMIIAYPIGFPLLLICLLLPQRAKIRELMEEVLIKHLIREFLMSPLIICLRTHR